MTDVYAIFVENRSADRFQLSHEAWRREIIAFRERIPAI